MIFKTALQHAMVNSDALSTEFCEILGLSKIFGSLVKCGGSIFPGNPAFVGNVPIDGVMTGVETGVGLLTEGRNTSIMVKDHLDIYREIDASFPAWEGGRVVGNTVYAKDAAGDWISPLPRLMHAPEATNTFDDGRNLAGGGWTFQGLTPSLVEGIDGTTNAVLLDDNTTSFEYCYHTIGTPLGNTYSLIFYLNKNGTGIFAIQWATIAGVYQIDPNDGSIAVEVSGYFSQGDIAVLDDSADWWKVVVTFVNNVDASVNVYLHPARSVALGGGASGSAIGSNTVDALQLYRGMDHATALAMPPIFNLDGASVTRTACDLSFDAANQDDAQGTWLIEAEATGVASILDGFLTHSGNSIILSDSVNSQSLSADTTSHKIGVVYGAGTMKLNIDGVWHAEGPYDGTLLQGALDLFRNSSVVGYCGEIARYSEKDETIVDTWIAA